MRIVLPLPHKSLSPNARVHWAAKARVVKQTRFDACLCVSLWMKTWGWKDAPRWKAATVRCRFYFRTKARRDSDNCAASCKAIWDGFTDAGVWVDDCGVTHLPPELHVDKANPRLEIEVTES